MFQYSAAHTSTAEFTMPGRAASATIEPETNERREQIIAEITRFVALAKAERQHHAAGPHSFGKDLKRKKSLFNAALLSVIEYLRRHQAADCAPGLLVVISANCDNDNRVCTLSVQRMGKLLNRSTEAIRGAIDRLEADGLLGARERRGDTTQVWPLVPEQVLDAHHAWIVDTFAEPSRKRGRPEKPLRADPPPFSDDQKEKPLRVAPQGYSENPSPPGRKTPPPLPVGEFSLRVQKTKGADKPALHGGDLFKHPGATPSRPAGERVQTSKRGAADPRPKVPASSNSDVDDAISEWNTHAEANNWVPAGVVTPQTRNWVAKRVREIGGLEIWRAAVKRAAVDDFLCRRKADRFGKLRREFGLDDLLRVTDNSDLLARLANEALAAGAGTAPASAEDAFVAAELQKPARRRQIEKDGMEKTVAFLRELHRSINSGGARHG